MKNIGGLKYLERVILEGILYTLYDGIIYRVYHKPYMTWTIHYGPYDIDQ